MSSLTDVSFSLSHLSLLPSPSLCRCVCRHTDTRSVYVHKGCPKWIHCVCRCVFVFCENFSLSLSSFFPPLMSSDGAKRLWAFAFLAAVVAAAELYCPFTKVEESFNMQAMHDFLYEDDTLGFDHHRFPGVVPRTFLGPWAVSFIALLSLAAAACGVRGLSPLMTSAPSRCMSQLLREQPMLASHVCRLSLAAVVLSSLLWVASALDRRRPFKSPLRRWGPLSSRGAVFLLLCASQFHLVLYASRPLPNTFGLVFCNVALRQTLLGRLGGGVAALTAGAALFRCDLLVLLAPYSLYAVFVGAPPPPSSSSLRTEGTAAATAAATVASDKAEEGGHRKRRRLSLRRGIAIGVLTAVVGVAATAPGLDSLLWGRWLWPEGAVFLFNTKENRSSEWGVMPWHWYWSRALPRALLCVYPAALALGGCAAGGLLLRCASAAASPFFFRDAPRRVAARLSALQLFRVADELEGVLVPSFAFIACYSALPHKELRFILVAVPWLLAPVAALLAEDGEEEEEEGERKGEREGRDGARVGGGEADERQRTRRVEDREGFERCATTSRQTRPGNVWPLAPPHTALLLLYWLMLASLVLSVVVAEANYPGGDALRRLHTQIIADAEAALNETTSSSSRCFPRTASDAAAHIGAAGERRVVVFIDAYAAMTGINRFQRRHTPIVVAPHQRGFHDVTVGGADDDSSLWRRVERLLRLPVEAFAWRTRECLGPTFSFATSENGTGLLGAIVHALESTRMVSSGNSARAESEEHRLCRFAFRHDDELEAMDRRTEGPGASPPAAPVRLEYLKDPDRFLTAAESAARRRSVAGPLGGRGPRAAGDDDGGREEPAEVYKPEGIDYALVRASQRQLHLSLHSDFALLFEVEERSASLLRRWRRQAAGVVKGALAGLRGRPTREEGRGAAAGDDVFLLALRRKRC